MKGKRMCPNAECPKAFQATGLMGGCDCGTALVPFKTAEEDISDKLWEIAAPGMKRMVGAATFAQIDRERRERRGER